MGSQAYLRSWEAIGEMLNQGRSWSGRERNCCLINTRDGRFVDVSALAGLDQEIDSRAVVVTDWDHDGDLDLWYSNRMSPRIRLMQNQLQNQNYLQLRLVGKTCNRDAIGARATIYPAGAPDTPIVRVVNAGDGYLSQSSKWLHFGLGRHAKISKLVVQWPSGDKQEFGNLIHNRRYQILQGESPQPLTISARRIPVASGPAELLQVGPRRIVPHAPIPFPDVAFRTFESEKKQVLSNANASTLIVLWTSWCQPCIAELREFGESEKVLRNSGLRILPLNCDELAGDERSDQAAIQRLLESTGLEGGIMSESVLNILNAFRSAITNTRDSIAVPTSFLVDPRGRLVAFYEGQTSADQLKTDLELLVTTRAPSDRDIGVPFSGRWYINPMPTDLLGFVEKMVDVGVPVSAFDYLEKNVRRPFLDGAKQFFLPADRVVATYVRVAVTLGKAKEYASAETALRFVLEVQPEHWQARTALASLYSVQGKSQATLEEFEVMLKQRPNDLGISNNVAWMLTTSPDRSLHDPKRGLLLAESLVARTQGKNPMFLDTLAAAFAANGRFDAAVKTAQTANDLASKSRQSKLAERIKKRLNLYNDRTPFVDN